MNVLVIGYGSIGKRHSRLLHEQGHNVATVSRQKTTDFPLYHTLNEAIHTFSPDAIIIANRTDEHYHTFYTLRKLGYEGTILIEKPLFTHPSEQLPNTKNVFVAYNLRFHPVLQRLKWLLQQKFVVSVQVYAGQYLPTWRFEDYRLSYSAKRKQGGGVLRDLSHELDYIQWLFGKWKQVIALGGHYSQLELDSEDVFALLIETQACPVINIQLNYLDHIRQRQMIINTNQHTYVADLIHHTLQVDKQIETYPCDADFTYRAQHQAWLKGQYTSLCSVDEAMETIKLIQAAEQSARDGRRMMEGGS